MAEGSRLRTSTGARSGESRYVSISHYYCELASDALARNALDEAQHAIDEALAANRKSIRALMLAGDIAAKRGEPDEALRQWRRVEDASAEYVPLIAARVWTRWLRRGASRMR